MTEPGFMVCTISPVTSRGAGRPGICAVVMTMSMSAIAALTVSRTRFCWSSASSLA